MNRNGIRVCAAASAVALAAAGMVAVASSAGAAEKTATSFTVDTQFVDGPSFIIDASGPMAACTEVADRSNEPGGRTRNQALFSGLKVLTCGSAQVTVGYEAFMAFPTSPLGAGRRTFGNWWIVSSNLPGVTTGGGKLMGDSRYCTLVEGSGGCILDVFSGFVS